MMNMKVFTRENFEAAGESVKKAEKILREMYDDLHASGKATSQDMHRFGKLLIALGGVEDHIHFSTRVYFASPATIEIGTTEPDSAR